jgi:hypothetical protein
MHPLIADFINGIDPSPPSGWMEDSTSKLSFMLGTQTKAPRNPVRSQNSTGQSLRQRPWSA